MAVATFAAVIAIVAATSFAAPPAERLLPATTKGFIATQDLAEAHKKFDETQWGALAKHPLMEPFVGDLRRQVREKLERASRGIGLTWEDLESASGGEVAAALIQPNAQDKMFHATALLVDITGKEIQADALLKKFEANQTAKKARRTTLNEAGFEITQYEQPIQAGETEPARSLLCVTTDQLIVTDHAATMRGIVQRLDGKAKDSLASVAAFHETLKRCTAAAGGVRYQLRWFIEPLGFAETSRAAGGGKQRRGVDKLKVIQTQGFTAIQGIGGHVFFAADAGGTAAGDRPEILHRTYVYAPAVKRAPGDKNEDKYDLAMRMLDFPNTAPGALDPQPWTLPDVASYLSFNWKMRQAFDYAGTLVDALENDPGLFAEMWKGKKAGAAGPPIDIYADLLDRLATRATLLSDVKLPVDAKSERQLAIFELKSPADTAAVAKTLETNYKGHELAMPRVIQGQVIWEVEQTRQADEPVAKRKAKANPRAAPRKLAITACLGHFIVSTHVDFIEDFLKRQDQQAGLAQEVDHQRVRAALAALGSKNDSLRYFSRTDESYRANYELFKQGKLSAAETLLAALLSALLGSSDDSGHRQPEFDGSKLPDFESIKKYLGPSGLFTQAEEDGWWIVGCLLKRR
jgi:hypothetical protein